MAEKNYVLVREDHKDDFEKKINDYFIRGYTVINGCFQHTPFSCLMEKSSVMEKRMNKKPGGDL